MQVLKRKELKLSEILEYFKKRVGNFRSKGISHDSYEMYSFVLEEGFDLYRKPSNEPLEKDMVCCVDDEVTGNDGNEDVYPEFVIKNNLEFCCSGEIFVDVILSVCSQVENPSIENFIDAINFYNEHDNYLDIS